MLTNWKLAILNWKKTQSQTSVTVALFPEMVTLYDKLFFFALLTAFILKSFHLPHCAPSSFSQVELLLPCCLSSVSLEEQFSTVSRWQAMDGRHFLLLSRSLLFLIFRDKAVFAVDHRKLKSPMTWYGEGRGLLHFRSTAVGVKGRGTFTSQSYC